MQTFLPYPSFKLSAACLDKKRAWKQVVETKQIINTLAGESKGWVNHPATRMWRGYEPALVVYYNVFWQHCVDVHLIKANKLQLLPSPAYYKLPPWIGYEPFHAAHRSNLLRKDEKFYRQFGWTEPLDLEYIWPVDKEGKLCLN